MTSSTRHADRLDCDGQAVGNLLHADVRALDAARRVLAQAVDEKASVEVDERVVDGRAAEVDARDELHSGQFHRKSPGMSSDPFDGTRTVSIRVPSGWLALDALADALDGFADVALHLAVALAHVS